MRDLRGWILVALVGASVGLVFSLDRIAQDLNYHALADERTWFGVPHALDVLSNLAFLATGLWGFAITRRLVPGALKPAWFVFLSGVVLVSAGSGWYHLAPANSTLFWDRMPIAMGFMALFSMVVHDRVSARFGRWMLWPAVVAGVGTVLFWHITEQRGVGDLRPYALVQGVPLLVIPVILLLYRRGRMRSGYMWATLGTYALAKFAEAWDHAVYHATAELLSGHNLKHLLAALAVAFAVAAFTGPSVPDRQGKENR